MEKLELKHLAPYLPYGLKVTKEDWRRIFKLDIYGTTLNCVGIEFVLNRQAKPILRPLSDLTKEIEVNKKKFIPIRWLIPESFGYIENMEISDFLDRNVVIVSNITTKEEFHLYTDKFISVSTRNHIFNVSDFKIIQKLIEWHFDVFGLIEKGLAIDFNTLQNGRN